MSHEQDNGPISELYVYYCQGRMPPGAAVTSEQFIGNWEEDGFSFLFYTQPSRPAVEALLAEQPQLSLLDEYHLSYADWLGEKPTAARIGGFTICPPWQNPADAGGRRIVLDPGVVFGTGTHPTTRDCLAAIETIYALETPQTVLDLGTGTGLLALAAGRLGGRRILAVDNNILAVRTARRNVRLNRLERVILAVQGRAEDVAGQPADLLLANLHYDVLKRLICAENLAGKRWLVLSGLLRSQAKDLEQQLAQLPVNVVRKWECEGTWFTLMVIAARRLDRLDPKGDV